MVEKVEPLYIPGGSVKRQGKHHGKLFILQKVKHSQALVLTPVVLATWKAEIRRILV
jgi:hypothetical protein